VLVDLIYNYKKAYNKYYNNNKDSKDNEEDFYRDGDNSQVAEGSSQDNYPNDYPTTLPLPLAILNI